jgi:hypothetical protein
MATVVTVSGKGSPLTHTEFDANFTNLNTDKLDDAASNGSQYIRQNGAWSNFTVDALVETSSTKPSSPIDGHAWFSESNGVTYVYDSASGDWVAIGASSGESGVRALRSLGDVSISSPSGKEALSYDSSAGSWSKTNRNTSVSTANLFSQTYTLGSGVWLIDVRMSISSGTYTSSFPNLGQASIKIETYADTGSYANQWRTEQPYLSAGSWSGASLYVTNGYAGNTDPISGAVVKLVEVSSSYQIRASSVKEYLSCDIRAELTAVKVGDV